MLFWYAYTQRDSAYAFRIIRLGKTPRLDRFAVDLKSAHSHYLLQLWSPIPFEGAPYKFLAPYAQHCTKGADNVSRTPMHPAITFKAAYGGNYIIQCFWPRRQPHCLPWVYKTHSQPTLVQILGEHAMVFALRKSCSATTSCKFCWKDNAFCKRTSNLEPPQDVANGMRAFAWVQCFAVEAMEGIFSSGKRSTWLNIYLCAQHGELNHPLVSGAVPLARLMSLSTVLWCGTLRKHARRHSRWGSQCNVHSFF